MAMPQFTMRQLLEAGVHFGHHTRRWNPKMKPYLFGVRNGVHIIDLTKTVPLLEQALIQVRQVVSNGGRVLFVGTKAAAAERIADAAKRCGQYYVNHRWLGGMITNWQTISASIKRLRELDERLKGDVIGLTKKEQLDLTRERDKLERSLGGIKEMGGTPDMLFIIDTNKEAIAVQEARKRGIPIVAVLDSNSDPDGIDFPIPGNDDALRAIKLFASKISDAVIEGRHAFEQSQLAEQKTAADAVQPAEAVEYVDTSRYESYEKQEGDFVEPSAEPVADPFAEPEPDAAKGAVE
jgi:small subunit ribosomal protein S2